MDCYQVASPFPGIRFASEVLTYKFSVWYLPWMGSTAEKLMKCNSLDDDFASDVKEFYILLFNCLVHFLPIYIYISIFFFPMRAIPWDPGNHCMWIFSREKTGRGTDRFDSGAVFYVTLQQCLFPLGKTKWWIPCRGCKETLITVAYSPLWLNSCHFKSVFHSLDLFVWEVSYIIKANSLLWFCFFSQMFSLKLVLSVAG